MEKKRVGVITFHNYDNYGAILQSYGLQKKLRELGTYPEIIDYSCQYISNPFRLVNLKEKGLFNYIYGAIGHICYIPRRQNCNEQTSIKTVMSKNEPKYCYGSKQIMIPASDEFFMRKKIINKFNHQKQCEGVVNSIYHYSSSRSYKNWSE